MLYETIKRGKGTEDKMSNSIRESNIIVFNDSMDFVKNNFSKEIQDSIKNQSIILENESVSHQDKYDIPCKIYVTENSSFNAAREYFGKKVAVLNFASATTPGGGVTKGSSAQEECLCRCSTLYNCLNVRTNWDKYYNVHRNEGSALHNDDIIYTPNVIIFKDDSYNMLDKSDYMIVDVITCAAPNLKENPYNAYNVEKSTAKVDISDEDLLKLHEKRGRKIMSVAADHNVEVLILGAFGCGAFRNNPTVVAQAYKNILPEFRKCFKAIEFAVYCRPTDNTNYRVFNEILRG